MQEARTIIHGANSISDAANIKAPLLAFARKQGAFVFGEKL
jgi:hypothetical protein